MYDTATGATQRYLTTSEVAGFLARHPIIAARVAAFNTAATLLDCSQIYEPRKWSEIELPIPYMITPQGIEVEDSQFGTVVIFPDAGCNLRYSGFVSDAPGDIGGPWLPDVDVPGSIWEDAKSALETLALIGGAIGAIFVIKELRK